MSTLHQQLKDAAQQALRDRETWKREKLSFFVSLLEDRAETLKLPELPDPEAIALLRKYSAQMITVEAQARNAGRKEQEHELIREQDLLRPFLPAAPDPHQVHRWVTDACRELDIQSARDTKQVIQQVQTLHPQVETRLIAQVVQEYLAHQ